MDSLIFFYLHSCICSNIYIDTFFLSFWCFHCCVSQINRTIFCYPHLCSTDISERRRVVFGVSELHRWLKSTLFTRIIYSEAIYMYQMYDLEWLGSKFQLAYNLLYFFAIFMVIYIEDNIFMVKICKSENFSFGIFVSE